MLKPNQSLPHNLARARAICVLAGLTLSLTPPLWAQEKAAEPPTDAVAAEAKPASATKEPVMVAANEQGRNRGPDLAKLDAKEMAEAAAAAATAAVEEIATKEGAQSEESPTAAAPPNTGQNSTGAGEEGSVPPVEQPVPFEYTEEMKALAQERLKLELEYALRLQKLRNELADLELEKQQLESEISLAHTKQMKELQKVEQAKRQVQADSLVEREKLNQQAVLLGAEKDKLAAELELERQKTAKTLAELESATSKLQAEKAKLAAEQEVATAQNQQSIAGVVASKEKLEAEMALAQAEAQKELAALKEEKERMAAQVAVLEQRVALAESERLEKMVTDQLTKNPEYQQYLLDKKLFDARTEARQAEMAALTAEATLRQTAVEAETVLMEREINREHQRKNYDEFVYQEVEYAKEPFRDGKLFVTDRRIPMNDVILMPTADYVTSMIDYYNNKSTEYPIFLVIDNCPGGSVMAGYRILKAVQGSKAPVYVVVKSYAASMAATICTMAPRSFVYPNAIIHHHQMLYGSRGNMTQQADALKDAQKWWERLAGPVADRMGISLDEFVQRMYAKNADGEWAEFGTEAVKLKWADTVVEEIREVGTSQKPAEDQPPMVPWFALKEETDSKGAYKQLPKLGPFDAWYMINEEGYYRFQ